MTQIWIRRAELQKACEDCIEAILEERDEIKNEIETSKFDFLEFTSSWPFIQKVSRPCKTEEERERKFTYRKRNYHSLYYNQANATKTLLDACKNNAVENIAVDLDDYDNIKAFL